MIEKKRGKSGNLKAAAIGVAAGAVATAGVIAAMKKPEVKKAVKQARSVAFDKMQDIKDAIGNSASDRDDVENHEDK